MPAHFVAQVFLVGDSAAGSGLDDEWSVPSAVLALRHTFEGHTAVRAEAEVPMSYLKRAKHDAGDAMVIVARAVPAAVASTEVEAPTETTDPGTGRLYYRLGLTYAPHDLQLPSLNVGFEVLRQYTALEKPSDVAFVEGVWRVKAGCLVKVTLHMTTVARRYHVALVDKLPAGFEPINPELKGAATTAAMAATADGEEASWRSRWWCRPWFEHQNLRDERVEVRSGTWSGRSR